MRWYIGLLAMTTVLGIAVDSRLNKLENQVRSLSATIEACCVVLTKPGADIEGTRDLMLELRRRIKALEDERELPGRHELAGKKQ